jgi:hypothetical protein
MSTKLETTVLLLNKPYKFRGTDFWIYIGYPV